MRTCQNKGSEQYWEYQKDGVIGRGMYYLTFTKNHTLIVKKKKPKIVPTIWNYFYDSQQIGINELNLCLVEDKQDRELKLEECDTTNSSLSQRWTFQVINMKLSNVE